MTSLFQAAGQTLSDVSFEVLPGELLAVIGPVGAGKVRIMRQRSFVMISNCHI